MSSTYTPREGSVAWKVIEFLTTNPDETMTVDIIAAKFDCSRNAVHTSLAQAVAAGTLLRRPDAEDEIEYALGKGHPAISASKGRAPALPPPGASTGASQHAAKPTRNAPFWIDTAAVEIEKDVPLPAGRGRSIDWDLLLDKLEVNDSFPLPLNGKSAINKAMQIFKKRTNRTLAVRRVGDELRVWRVS